MFLISDSGPNIEMADPDSTPVKFGFKSTKKSPGSGSAKNTATLLVFNNPKKKEHVPELV